DGTGAQGGFLSAGPGHFPDDAGDQHLQSPAGTAGGNVDVATIAATGGANELTVLIDQFAIRQFANFGRGIGDANGDIGGGFFDGGWGFAAVSLAIDAVHLLDEDGL